MRVLKLNKSYLEQMEKLNSKRKVFNINNKDFFCEYNNSNFAAQLFLRKRVRMLMSGELPIGYIWIEPESKDVNRINSMYVQNDDKDKEVIFYDTLLKSLPKNKINLYSCSINKNNENMLKSLMFSVKSGTITLKKEIKDHVNVNVPNNISFKAFEKNVDERLRCEVQNGIFKNNKRIPLSVDDIFFDETQDYYLENASLFIYLDKICIGYGQLMMENENITVVNFGLLEEYRGKGFGVYLLDKLIDIAKGLNFHEVYIKVSAQNTRALSLYKKMGFNEYSKINDYCYIT